MNEINVIYNVSHQPAFGFMIGLFIAVTGLNAGSYLASMIFNYVGKKEYQPLAQFSAIVVMALWVVAPLLLLLDIGQPLRIWHLFVYFDPRSPMAWGAVVLAVYPVVASIYFWHLFGGDQKKSRMWGFIGLPIALGSHGFVGFVLSFANAHVLWSTPLTPIFFMISAALSGLALVVIFDSIRYYVILPRIAGAQARERIIFHHLGEALYILIFGELALILFYLLQMGLTPNLFNYALTLLNEGKISAMDLFLPVVLGLILPLVLLIFPRSNNPLGQLVASSLIILGVFSMANLVISAAQSLPLL